MRCMHCDQDTSVIDTRVQPNNTIKRKRRCPNGHVFVTFEGTTDPTRWAETRRRARRSYRRRNPKTPEERKRERLRRAARIEARETGEPVEAIYERYGVK